jgi:hypothetical protein
VRAFKFLDAQGATVMSGSRWPLPSGDEPGPWLEAAAVRPCHEGVHACTAGDLAYWLDEELWEIELDGGILLTHRKVVARRGRLLRRVEGWSGGVAMGLLNWSAWRTRDLAVTVLGDEGETAWASHFTEATSLHDVAALGRDAAAALGDATVGGVAAGLAGDAAALTPTGHLAMGPFVAACAAGHAAKRGTGTEFEYGHAFVVEREAQSDWIARHLQIE